MADTVLYEVTDGLATITLNRPDAMNAMNTEAKVALRDALQAAAADAAVRAVLLTAAGDRAFCVGQDLKEHVGLLTADREAGTRRHHEHRARALQPDPAGPDRRCPSRSWPRSTASPRGPVSASRSPPTTGSSPTPRPSTPPSRASR